jgi:GNAT superfamily N-acetyltransferase
LARLVDATFMRGNEGAMLRMFPALFNENNLENCLVFVDGERVVSHVGMIQRWACLEGCTVRVACIGAVSTWEEHRGQGLATRLFQAACEKALAEGVDFMMISGGRNVYRRAGAADVGRDHVATVDRKVADSLRGDEMEVRDFTEADLPDCIAAYAKRPARFIRPLEDWRWLVDSRICMCREVRILVARRRNTFLGYFLLANTNEEGACQILEFACNEAYATASLALLMERCGCAALKIRFQTADRAIMESCKGANIPLEPVTTGGTLLLINFPQLMARLRPLIEARMGRKNAMRLQFEERDGRFVIASDEETLTLNKADAAQLVFGHPQARPLSGLLAEVFPVPTLWYGINYV